MKRVLITFAILILSGCVTSTSREQNDTTTQLEQNYKIANNHLALIDLYKEQLTLDVNNASILYKLANSYYTIGDNYSAKFYLSKIEGERTTQSDVLLLSAQIDVKETRYNEALDKLESISASGQQNKQVYMLYGIIYSHLEEYRLAVEHFNESRLYGGNDEEVKNNISVVYISQGNYSKATDMLVDLLKFNPDNEKAKFNLAIVKIKERKFGDAARILGDDFSENDISIIFNYSE
ncbi:tetratricopeptide repeat protein [Vibrio nomapromontoriensis]|uniref:tetratricopeptide repeat protein n=1 Tax=Vibrio nomapromontoriensis TaxID=2910246 RepID=UPI003D0EAA40